MDKVPPGSGNQNRFLQNRIRGFSVRARRVRRARARRLPGLNTEEEIAVKRSRAAACAVAVLAMGVAAGCGSSDDSDTTSSTAASTTAATTTTAGNAQAAEAKQAMQDITPRPTSIGIDEPIEGGVQPGKTIDYLACGVPACAELGESLKKAAKEVGWKIKVVNQGLSPEEVKAAWEQVVRDKPDAVVTTGGFPLEVYAKELAQFKKEGGVMVSVADVQPAEPDKGYIAAISGAERSKLAGVQMAKWVIAETDGKANVQMINVSGFPSIVMQYEGFKSTLEEMCPDCSMKTYDAPLDSFGKELPGDIAQQLQSNPNANALVLGSGDMAVGLPAALKGAGIDPPAAITQGQTPAIAQVMKEGGISAIWGQELAEIMWRSVDVLARHFAGQSVEPDIEADTAVQWLLTNENIPSTTEPFPLVEDYQDQYRQLWGLG
jgi:ribose transport system substrate-binding protein